MHCPALLGGQYVAQRVPMFCGHSPQVHPAMQKEFEADPDDAVKTTAAASANRLVNNRRYVFRMVPSSYWLLVVVERRWAPLERGPFHNHKRCSVGAGGAIATGRRRIRCGPTLNRRWWNAPLGLRPPSDETINQQDDLHSSSLQRQTFQPTTTFSLERIGIIGAARALGRGERCRRPTA
jgi:hypothetical protein